MSAWVVSETHIDALITAAGKLSRPDRPFRWKTTNGTWRELERYEEDAVGAMLLAENQASVNHLYSDNELEPFYVFSALPGNPDPVTVLKLLSCYEYQSCEHPGWETSEAKSYCESLRHLAINCLPGYAAAPWATDSRDVFTAVPAKVAGV